MICFPMGYFLSTTTSFDTTNLSKMQKVLVENWEKEYWRELNICKKLMR